MRKIVLPALFILLLCSAAFAMLNEPMEFRGIKLGDSVEKHEKILIAADRTNPEFKRVFGFEFYKKVNENYKLGEGSIDGARYFFGSAGFYSTHIYFSGSKDNRLIVLEACTNQ